MGDTICELFAALIASLIVTVGIFIGILLYEIEYIFPETLMDGRVIVIDEDRSVTCKPTEKTLEILTLKGKIDIIKKQENK